MTWHTHLNLDVDVGDDESLHGRIGRDGESAAEFIGWLGLLATLDRMLARPNSDGSGPCPPPTGLEPNPRVE